MDRKREVTSVDLVALVAELNDYRGAVVDKAYLYGDDLVRLKLRDFDRGRLELLVEVGQVKRAHLARPEHVPDAPGRPPDFAKMLRNRIAGAELAGVSQYDFDRILSFEFRREDQDTVVVAELFGEGNVAVLDQGRTVVDCLHTVRLKSRTVAPGSRYEFPTAQVDPLSVDREGFGEAMRESDADLVRTLATRLNFGGLWAEELCTRAGVEKGRPIADATAEDLDRLYDAMGRLLDPIEAGDLDPRVYYEADDEDPAVGENRGGNQADGETQAGGDGDGEAQAEDEPDGERGADGEDGPGSAAGDGRRGRRVDATPVPMEEYAGLPSVAFDSFTAALDDYFTNLETAEDEAEEAGRPEFEAEIAKRERIVAQQEEGIERFAERAAAEREKAELLYANYDLVDEILTTVREAREAGHGWADVRAGFEEGRERGIEAAEAVAGVDPEAGTVTVRLDDHEVGLDPSDGVEKNADRLYGEAKRVEDKREGALAAVEETREELAALEERRDAWEAGEADDEDEDEPEEVDWLSRPSVPVRRQEHWYERFRWFRTTDGFLVLGGRSADQNEELVDKYMDPYDLFVHSQVHGGPATVLKTSAPSEPSREVEVPEASRRQAAQFAVSYGSVWKDGKFSGDAYAVRPEQVSKTPESGEYLEKGSFAIRGERSYYRDVPVACVVGVACEPETRVLGGPPDAVLPRVETAARVEPGRFAQSDVAKRVYRAFRERFADETLVRKVASPDRIAEFLPPGGSRILDDG